MTDVAISLRVNGRPVEVSVEPRLTLAGLLRRQLRLTGTHLGCEHGVCWHFVGHYLAYRSQEWKGQPWKDHGLYIHKLLNKMHIYK